MLYAYSHVSLLKMIELNEHLHDDVRIFFILSIIFKNRKHF